MSLDLDFDVTRLPEIRQAWAEATKGMTKAERLDFAKWIESLKETTKQNVDNSESD